MNGHELHGIIARCVAHFVRSQRCDGIVFVSFLDECAAGFDEVAQVVEELMQRMGADDLRGLLAPALGEVAQAAQRHGLRQPEETLRNVDGRRDVALLCCQLALRLAYARQDFGTARNILQSSFGGKVVFEERQLGAKALRIDIECGRAATRKSATGCEASRIRRIAMASRSSGVCSRSAPFTLIGMPRRVSSATSSSRL